MNIFIQLTSAGTSVGPFDLYSDVDLITPFASGVSRADLLIGITYTVDNGTTSVLIQSTGTCTNNITVNVVAPITTSTTSTLLIATTTSTTSTPTSTSTTTTTIPTTTTTTTNVEYVALLVKLGDTGWPGVCSNPEVTRYALSGFNIGIILYTDMILTIPVTGSTIVVDYGGDHSTYNIDVSTGEVLSVEGNTCA